MSFRTDKIRGAHPITPKKGIKEVDLNIGEKGTNDRITVSVKPQGSGIISIPHDSTNSWDHVGFEERLDLLRYLNIDANSTNGKKYIFMSYLELPKHLQVELTKRQRELDKLHEKWRTTFGYRPNKFKKLSSGELENEINAYNRTIQTFKNQIERYGHNTQLNSDINDLEHKISDIRNELGIRRVENDMLENKINYLEKNSNDTLMNIRRNTKNQIEYDAVVWVFRKRNLWKGSTEKTEKFLRDMK